MTEISLEEVQRQLVAAGITGPHQSHSRHNAISKIRACVSGDEDGCFGLSGLTLQSEEDVLGYMAELTGCSPDIADLSGYDTIDPEKTVGGIVAAAERLKAAADEGAVLLVVTGHPTGMLEHN